MDTELAQALNRKVLSASVIKPLWKRGDEVFDLIIELLRANSGTARQVSNGIIILRDLVRQPCLSRIQDLYNVAFEFLESDSSAVVQQAVCATTGLVHLSQTEPRLHQLSFDEDALSEALRGAPQSLLTNKEIGLIERFLDSKESGCL